MKKYITRQEAAKMLSVDPQTVSNLVERGVIGGRKKKVNDGDIEYKLVTKEYKVK